MALRPSLNVLAAAVIGLGTTTAANAELVTVWDYTVTTEWDSATFGGNGSAGTTFTSEHVLSWGADAPPLDPLTAHTVPGADRSGLNIEPQSDVSGSVNTNAGFEPTHTITHFNNAIDAAFETLTAASVLTTLTLTPNTPPGGADPAESPFSTTFLVDFTETLNAAPCGFDSATICDDIFVVRFPGDLTTSFVYDGIEYTIEIGGALAPLSDEACEAAGATAPCVGLQTLENAFTQAPFAFQITAAVPEPGVLALIGLGLAGLGVASRRRAN